MSRDGETLQERGGAGQNLHTDTFPQPRTQGRATTQTQGGGVPPGHKWVIQNPQVPSGAPSPQSHPSAVGSLRDDSRALLGLLKPPAARALAPARPLGSR